MLRAESVSKQYGPVVALEEVSVSVDRGDCLVLIGESGSGKTTLLRCFNALVRPDRGRVYVEGSPVSEADPVALRRRIGYVPQDGGLMPHWRVQRNVELVPWLRGMPDRETRAHEALRLVGLDPAEVGRRWPGQLSGGQRQRVALARALAARPDVVLLDEPFAALDAITRNELLLAFAALRRELAVTAVFVTHDLREAMRLATTVAVLRRGRIEQAASPDALRSAPATSYVAALLRQADLVR